MIMETKLGTYTKVLDGNKETFDFHFYTDLSISNKIRFINNVVNSVIDENRYISIIRDMIFDYEIIDIFTDIDISEITESPDAISFIEDFLNSTNIVEIVKNEVNKGVIEELSKAVDDGIEYKTGIHKNSILTSVSKLVDTLTEQVEATDMTGLMEIVSKFNGIQGEMTPEKILEAYSKTNYFKDKKEEIKNNLDKKKKSEEVIKPTIALLNNK